MDEKDSVFSELIEKAYESEMEFAIKVPDGFKDAALNKIKIEKAKSKRKMIVAFSSVAAALVIGAGIFYAASSLNYGANAKRADEYSVEENSFSEKTSENVFYFDTDSDGQPGESLPDVKEFTVESSLSESREAPTELEAFFETHLFYGEDGKVLSWHDFYNSCVNGEIDPSAEDARSFLEVCHGFFTDRDYKEEAAKAEGLLSSVKGSDGQ